MDTHNEVCVFTVYSTHCTGCLIDGVMYYHGYFRSNKN